jgi:hypothetical protein
MVSMMSKSSIGSFLLVVPDEALVLRFRDILERFRYGNDGNGKGFTGKEEIDGALHVRAINKNGHRCLRCTLVLADEVFSTILMDIVDSYKH